MHDVFYQPFFIVPEVPAGGNLIETPGISAYNGTILMFCAGLA
jgi:hypothetical protein